MLDFVGTWDDSWAVTNAILARGDVTPIPDLWYETASPTLFKTLDDALMALLRRRRRVYIWSTAFSRSPPVLERQDSGPQAGKFFLRLPLGGPGLELTLPACFEATGVVYLNFGGLSYPREILSPETGQWEGPSRLLKAGYADLRRRLCGRVLVREEGVWAGPQAKALLRDGRARMVRRRSGGV